MLSSVEQVFVGREEIRAPLKTPAWEARGVVGRLKYFKRCLQALHFSIPLYFPLFPFLLPSNFFCSSALIKEPGTGYVLKNTNKVVG